MGSRLVAWLQASRSPFSESGYWSGVVRCFSTSEPSTRISAASASTARTVAPRRSGDRAARRSVLPRAATAPVLDRAAGRTEAAAPAEREEDGDVEGEDDDQVQHG